MMRKLNCLLVAMILIVTLVATTSVAYASSWATVIEPKGLNYRDAPQGNIIGTLRYGSKVEVLSGPDRNSYYKVRINGHEYYMYSTGPEDPAHYNLSFSGTVPTQTQTTHTTSTSTSTSPKSSKALEFKYFYCHIGPDECECECYGLVFVKTEMRLRLRQKPSLESGTKAWLDHGKPMIVLNNKVQNGFVKVKDPVTGMVGWSWATLLSTDMLSDVTYATEPCEGGCCEHEEGTECFTSIQFSK